MEKRVVTIYDVASRANVSIATVSRVINGSAKTRATTRATVLRVIDELGFVPNPNAVATARLRAE